MTEYIVQNIVIAFVIACGTALIVARTFRPPKIIRLKTDDYEIEARSIDEIGVALELLEQAKKGGSHGHENRPA